MFSVNDCFVYNTDKTQKYAIIEGKCGDDYVNTRSYDPTAVSERARFSYTVFEFVDAIEGEENQTLQDQLKNYFINYFLYFIIYDLN